MCSLFSTTSQTDRGKKFFRQNENDFDDKMVYKKFHGFYATFVLSMVSESDMLSCMTSAKFDTWQGTTKTFIIKWKD